MWYRIINDYHNCNFFRNIIYLSAESNSYIQQIQIENINYINSGFKQVGCKIGKSEVLIKIRFFDAKKAEHFCFEHQKLFPKKSNRINNNQFLLFSFDAVNHKLFEQVYHPDSYTIVMFYAFKQTKEDLHNLYQFLLKHKVPQLVLQNIKTIIKYQLIHYPQQSIREEVAMVTAPFLQLTQQTVTDNNLEQLVSEALQDLTITPKIVEEVFSHKQQPKSIIDLPSFNAVLPKCMI